MIKHISKTKKTFDFYSKHRTQTRYFSIKETKELLNNVILNALYGIIDYKCKDGFNINHIDQIKDVVKETPTSFQERFFLLMDIIDPCREYARIFIKREHPDALYLYDWFVKLYIEETETDTSIVDINNVD